MRNFTPKEFSSVSLAFAIDIAAGMPLKDVALKHQVSLTTVSKELTRIYRLLGVRSNVGLAHWALHHKLLKNNFESLPEL